uniref:uncharacterized protein LOC120338011 n=1 Tax=Styela clava TaxID=7725 RepID=UPI00193A75DB|nr:uncharacterized protein LOC120338011 [Styela clava]
MTNLKFLLLYFVIFELSIEHANTIGRGLMGGYTDGLRLGQTVKEYQTDVEPFSDTFSCSNISRAYSRPDLVPYDPSVEFMEMFWRNFGPEFIYAGPESMFTGYNVMETAIIPKIDELKSTACSLRRRILNSTAHDILESYNSLDAIESVTHMGRYTSKDHDKLKDLKNRSEKLWFMRHPNINDLLAAMKTFFCGFHTCNVGECVIGSEYGEAELEAVRIDLIKAWTKSVGTSDLDGKENIDFKSAMGMMQNNDEALNGVPLEDLLPYWVLLLAAIDRILFITTFLENNPTAENFMMAVWYSTQCDCLEDFKGEFCNVC